MIEQSSIIHKAPPVSIPSMFLCSAHDGGKAQPGEIPTCQDCISALVGFYDAHRIEAPGSWLDGTRAQAVNVADGYEKEIEELKDELRIEKEIRLHGCDCSEDEACEFARERDRYKRLIIRDKDGNIVTQAAFNALVAQRDTAWSMQEILKRDLERISDAQAEQE